jgi:hypothetical protein
MGTPKKQQNPLPFGQGTTSALWGHRLALGMQTLYKKASHLRAHTWKDVGGIGGLLLDGAFFVFLLITSAVVVVVGSIVVALNYLFSPVLSLLSSFRGSKKQFVDETILLDDGTLATRPTANAGISSFKTLTKA